MAKINVGTFNLNNLFSRFDFKGTLAQGETKTVEGVTTFTIAREALMFRTYDGKLVRSKRDADRETVAERIKSMDLDVLAVQEVEDLVTLETFVAEDLGGLYPYVTLVEGNDDRLIDVGLLSKLPIGAVTSWRHMPDPERTADRLFGRDLLQVEILSTDRKRVLFTIFNNHLKSKLVRAKEPGAAAEEEKENNRLRTRQAEAIADVIRNRLPEANAAFIVTGDLNDDPMAPTLEAIRKLEVKNGLEDPIESPPYQVHGEAPPTKAWTHRFVRGDAPPHYELFDQIWLSPSLAAKQLGGFIKRRTKPWGDGSDHDPAWVELDLDA